MRGTHNGIVDVRDIMERRMHFLRRYFQTKGITTKKYYKRVVEEGDEKLKKRQEDGEKKDGEDFPR